jgi:putative ABC transport system substrate-binding protein
VWQGTVEPSGGRREVVKLVPAWLAVALVLLPFATTLAPVAAQPRENVPRIGLLHPRTRADASRQHEAFLRGLRELGWIEGKTIVIESRWAEGRPDRVPDLVAELVRLRVDVILAGSTAVAVAAKDVTKTIPIVVATGGDPVRLGLVGSLARPGGNVTGLSFGVGMDTAGKGLELLKEAVPKVRRVAALSNPANPSHSLVTDSLSTVARAVGVELQLFEARGSDDFASAFAGMTRGRMEAILVYLDPFFLFHRARLLNLAAKNRLPAIYFSREYPEGGGLMSYGANYLDNYHRAATYVDKILKGAKPGELPIEQPTKFELVINLKTAKALGLTLPRSLLLRADHVIE